MCTLGPNLTSSLSVKIQLGLSAVLSPTIAPYSLSKVLLLVVFGSFFRRITRLLNLCVIPFSLLFTAALSFYWLQPALNLWLKQAHWLPYVSVVIAAAMAWQFGRSRLVWQAVLLLLLLPLSLPWLEPATQLSVRYCFILLVLCWLVCATDKGFAPVNLAMSLLIIGLLAASSVWLVPQLTSQAAIFQYLVQPVTGWLFKLWPQARQIFSAAELLLTLLSLVVLLVQNIRQQNNSQVALLMSGLSVMLLYVLAQPFANQLAVIVLSVMICIAVIRDSFAMAFKDELTGVPSRRALMQYVQTLGRKYTVVMSDIDHFKSFNDTYGHDVGDEVLKLVASKLSKITGGGKAFRYGGEEFIMLFAGKTAEQVLPHVEAIRQTIADYDIALRTKPRPSKAPKAKSQKPPREKIVKVTSSFGIAQRSAQHSDFASIMKQADVALYAAKKAGRNCVKVAKQ